MSGIAVMMALVRAVQTAATLSLLGTVGFQAWILPAAVPQPLRLRLHRLWTGSGLIAVLASGVSFALNFVADAQAGESGHRLVLLAGLALLLAATGLAGRSHGIAALYLSMGLIGLVMVLQVMTGHAGAVGLGLVLAGSLHGLAAGVWLGALVPFWLSLRDLAPGSVACVCRRVGRMGLACALVITVTAAIQSGVLIGSLPGLLGTGYGRIALLKTVLFLVALVSATQTGLLSPAWAVDRRHRLALSAGAWGLLAVALVTAASFMASVAPAVRTPVFWPFSWQFSLITVNEEPDFRMEVVVSLLAIGLAVALLAAAWLLGRFRLIALGVLTLVVVLRGPSLSLLTVEAYPTSFQTSPTGFAAAAIARGRTVFAANCTDCHGAKGDGQGPLAAGLRIKPADLTQQHLWDHTDGQMFWWLTHGIDDPEGGPEGSLAMPGFADSLSADDRWAVIDYIRAHNAGMAMQQDADFGIPIPAPALPVTCGGLAAVSMAELRGYAVHVVTAPNEIEDVPPQSGFTTVTLDLRHGVSPPPGGCVAGSKAAWDAYAVLADLPPADLPGSDFVIDPNGWLRAIHRAGTPGGWRTRNELIAAINGICTSPIQQLTEGQHEHHH